MKKRFYFISFILIVAGLACFALCLLIDWLRSTNWPYNNTRTATRQLEETYLFTDPDCMTACWSGLRPGETTVSELDEVITDFRSRTFDNEYTSYYKKYSRSFVALLFKDKTLSQINVEGSLNLSLARIIEVLGEPSGIRLRYEIAVNGTLESRLELYYPQEGYIFYHRPLAKRNSNNVTLCYDNEDTIGRFQVYAPTSLAQLIAQMYLPIGSAPSDASLQEEANKLRSWPGFTCIDLPYNRTGAEY